MRPERYTFLGMDTIVASEAMARTIELARRAARTPAAVLITGETGTGKEIVARAVHHFSLRCAKTWVDVNCGALAESLMESELFGHERGAFSGADTAKPGLFEMADRGTLFLDEVGELDARMQVKLLRVLDRVPYYRVGGIRKIEVDVRILAATNQDLEEASGTGRFRSDLYHRLNEFQIHVPPLRERVDDIVPLAEAFLARQSAEARFSEEAKRRLERYHWPGNVRELRNAVVNAIIAARQYEIGVEDLPARVREALRPQAPPTASQRELRLAGIERDAILSALAITDGHQQRAADLLGISRWTLARKLRLYRGERTAEDPALVS